MKRLIAINEIGIKQEIENAVFKALNTNHVYIDHKYKLYTEEELENEYENQLDDYYSLDEYLQMQGFAKFNINNKKFNSKTHILNWFNKLRYANSNLNLQISKECFEK